MSTNRTVIKPASGARGHARRPSTALIFWTFMVISLQGFGSTLPVARQVLCERRRWFSEQQYVEMLALGQVLPGSNVCNLALLGGRRLRGWPGAFAAVAGLVLAPFAIVVGLAMGYVHLVDVPEVAGAIRGIVTVAAGLVLGTAFRLATSLRGNLLRAPACVALGGAAFAGAALLHWPVLWLLLGMGAAACSLSWYRLRQAARHTTGDAVRKQ